MKIFHLFSYFSQPVLWCIKILILNLLNSRMLLNRSKHDFSNVIAFWFQSCTTLSNFPSPVCLRRSWRRTKTQIKFHYINALISPNTICSTLTSRCGCVKSWIKFNFRVIIVVGWLFIRLLSHPNSICFMFHANTHRKYVRFFQSDAFHLMHNIHI